MSETRRTPTRRTANPSSRSTTRQGARRSGTARQASQGARSSSQARRSSQRRSALDRQVGAYHAPAPRRRRKSNLAPILGLVFVGLVVLGALLVLFHPWEYKVQVNGTPVTVSRKATLAKVVETAIKDEAIDTPVPGNLMAVDGSLITEGGGNAFSATVDGKAKKDPDFVPAKGSTIEIGDGSDVTEDATVTEEAIPHGERTWDTEFSSYWNGSLHVYEKGEDGVRTTTTGKESGITVTEETKAPVDAGYHIYTADPGDDKVIALTFDDGPWPETTDAILDVLEENGAKATFFTIGNQIPEYADQVRREASLGCLVCTHSYDHAGGSGGGVNLTYMSSDEQVWEIQQGYAAIRDALGEEPVHILRAPGGNYYGDMIYTLEPYVDAEIGWDVDTEDWRLPGADAIYEAIMRARPGNVVLMHDGGGDRTQTVAAVQRAVPELIAQGYTLVTVDELLKYGEPSGVTVL